MRWLLKQSKIQLASKCILKASIFLDVHCMCLMGNQLEYSFQQGNISLLDKHHCLCLGKDPLTFIIKQYKLCLEDKVELPFHLKQFLSTNSKIHQGKVNKLLHHHQNKSSLNKLQDFISLVQDISIQLDIIYNYLIIIHHYRFQEDNLKVLMTQLNKIFHNRS